MKLSKILCTLFTFTVLFGALHTSPAAAQSEPEHTVSNMHVERALRDYFGRTIVPEEFDDYKRQRLAKTYLTWLGETFAPDYFEATLLDNGNYLIEGCRFHSCDEKAAIVMNKNNEILAAAAINSISAERSESVQSDMNDSYPWVDVGYVFLRSEDRDSENVKALRKWIADVDGPNRLIYRQIKP